MKAALLGIGLAGLLSCTGNVEPLEQRTSVVYEQNASFGGIVQLTEGNLESTLDGLGEQPYVIYTGADWCYGCTIIKPSYKQIAKDFGEDITFLEIDLTENEDPKTRTVDIMMREKLGVASPYLPRLVFKRGSSTLTLNGKLSYERISSLMDVYFFMPRTRSYDPGL